MNTFAVYIVNALANPDHAAIIAFSMMIGGMVGIITRNGGMGSVVRMIVSRARTAIGGQVAVWLMGLMIFFDDYANTLVVGNTARPITDHLKISREKLAYIVDSTAAPVVCIALITTWIGYEVSLIDDALQGIDELSGIPAYTIFLHSIPYSFYPILAVLFVLLVGVTGRDFGPMHTAEVRARRGQVIPTAGEPMPALEGDSLDAKPNVPLRAANAFVPILERLTKLLEAAPDAINQKGGSFGFTALHAATSKGRRDLARLLIVRGAEVNATDDMFDKTPLGEALYYGHEAMARLLYKHGARS
jgi:Na+/H+ antiporter NhaC